MKINLETKNQTTMLFNLTKKYFLMTSVLIISLLIVPFIKNKTKIVSCVVELFDISGDLLGDIYRQGREIAFYMSSHPEGHIPNSTNVWGAIPYKGYIYFTDMYSGLYCVRLISKGMAQNSP